MKHLIYLLIVVLIFGCSANPPKILETDIYTVEISEEGQEVLRAKVTVYLSNDGAKNASMRFEAASASPLKQKNLLYIWNNNIPELRNALQKIRSNDYSADDMLSTYQFGRDQGFIRQINTESAKYVTLFTIEGSFAFPLTEVPKIMSLLDKLEQAAKPIQ